MKSLYKVFGKFWDGVKVGDDKLHATQVLPEGIKEVLDIPYKDTGSKYHLLDIYYPEDTDKPLPVIIDIHGGGWMYATKDLNKIYNEYLAKRGFVVFSISYRLVPEVTVPEQLRDVAEALVKINELMNKYPCDKNNVMITGDSAGGQLVSFTAALAQSEYLREHFDTADHGIDFTCVALTSPVAFMNDSLPMGFYCRMMWGEKGFRRSLRKFMNINELLDVIDTYPPTFLVTSSGDFMALQQTRQLYKVLLMKGIDAQLLDFPKFKGKDLPHVFGVLEPYSEAGEIYIEKMCTFFRKYMR